MADSVYINLFNIDCDTTFYNTLSVTASWVLTSVHSVLKNEDREKNSPLRDSNARPTDPEYFVLYPWTKAPLHDSVPTNVTEKLYFWKQAYAI